MILVWSCLLASLGVGIRYLLSGLQIADFPIGSLSANVLGSFLIGLSASGVLDRYFEYLPKLVFIIAFLGAFTTFSSYALEVVKHLQEGKWGYLAICIFSHNLLSISACYIGLRSFSS